MINHDWTAITLVTSGHAVRGIKQCYFYKLRKNPEKYSWLPQLFSLIENEFECSRKKVFWSSKVLDCQLGWPQKRAPKIQQNQAQMTEKWILSSNHARESEELPFITGSKQIIFFKKFFRNDTKLRFFDDQLKSKIFNLLPVCKWYLRFKNITWLFDW